MEQVTGTTLTGSPSDPEFVGACLQAMSKEIHIVTNAFSILMSAMSGILSAFDSLNDEANIHFTGPARQILRDKVREVRETLGPHPLLTAMEDVCGREPLKLVVTNPVDPAA